MNRRPLVKRAIAFVSVVAYLILNLTVIRGQDLPGKSVAIVSHVKVLSQHVPDVSSLDSWKKSFIQGGTPSSSKVEKKQVHQQKQIIKTLQRELHRKEKALAEVAALLILEKKFQALWEDPEDEKLNSLSAKK